LALNNTREVHFDASLETAKSFQQRAASLRNAIVCRVESHQMSEPDNGASNKSAPRVMLNEAQVLQIIPVSRSTLWRLERKGAFPRSTYVSPNRRFWFADQIADWQRSVDEFNPNRGRGKGRRTRVSS
jgi:prophage regulatory protein